jgi:urease accessory protein
MSTAAVRVRHLLAACTGLVASPLALAHEGHAQTGMLAGMLHPLSGADHLMTTLGLGLLAGLAARLSTATGAGRLGAMTITRQGLAALLGLFAGLIGALVLDRFDTVQPMASLLTESAAMLGLAVVALLMARSGSGALPAGRLGLGVAFALVSLPHGVLHGLEGSGVAFFAGLLAVSAVGFAASATLGSWMGARMTQAGSMRPRQLAIGFALVSASLGWMMG